jgi:hypothetical protein
LEAPTLVFISETKIEATRAQNPTSRFGFAGCVHVASDGLSGGLVLYWSKEVEVELQKNSDQHIDVHVTNVGGDRKKWRFTGFYGKAKWSKRVESWTLIRWLRTQSDLPWLCG